MNFHGFRPRVLAVIVGAFLLAVLLNQLEQHAGGSSRLADELARFCTHNPGDSVCQPKKVGDK